MALICSMSHYRNRSHYFCAFSLSYTLSAIDLKKQINWKLHQTQTRDALHYTWLSSRKHSLLERCNWCDFAREQSFKSLSNTVISQMPNLSTDAWSFKPRCLHRHLSYFDLPEPASAPATGPECIFDCPLPSAPSILLQSENLELNTINKVIQRSLLIQGGAI